MQEEEGQLLEEEQEEGQLEEEEQEEGQLEEKHYVLYQTSWKRGKSSGMC